MLIVCILQDEISYGSGLTPHLLYATSGDINSNSHFLNKWILIFFAIAVTSPFLII